MKTLFLPAYFFPEHGASSYLDQNLKEEIAYNDICMLLYVPTPCRGITQSEKLEYSKRKHDYMYDGKLEIFRFSMFGEGKNPILRALRYVFCWCAQFWKGVRAKDVDLIYLASTPPIQGVLGGLLKKIKIWNTNYYVNTELVELFMNRAEAVADSVEVIESVS